MYTMKELVNSSEPNLSTIIAEQIIETCPWVGTFPFTTAPQQTFKGRRRTKLPGVGFRREGKEYTATKSTYDKYSVDLKFMGGEISFDRKTMKTTNVEKAQQFLAELEAIAMSMGMFLKKNIVNGDTADDEDGFDGIKKIFKDLPSSQSIKLAGAANGTTLTTAGEKAIIEAFEQALNACKGYPDFALANRNIYSEIAAIMITSAKTSELATKFSFKKVVVMAARDGRAEIAVRVMYYNDLPVYAVDEDENDEAIMDYDEKVGNNSTNTSIIFVKTGRGFLFGLQDRAEGAEVVPIDTKVGRAWIVDDSRALALEHPKALARIVGIRAPA